MAKGYWVACVNILNPDKFKKYAELAGPAINLHGGKFLVRGNNVTHIEGKRFTRVVISVFDTPEKAKECYNSKEYQYAKSFLKEDVAERIIHIAEGLD